MVRDSKRFADSGSREYVELGYDAAPDTFSAGTLAHKCPQANDAKCDFECHTVVANEDYVFAAYGKR